MEITVPGNFEVHMRSEVVRADVYRGVFDIIGTSESTRGHGIEGQVTKKTFPDRTSAENAAKIDADLWAKTHVRKP